MRFGRFSQYLSIETLYPILKPVFPLRKPQVYSMSMIYVKCLKLKAWQQKYISAMGLS